MGYLHINNLYREQDILLFKECYAMEKIHGTSAHLSFKVNPLGDVETHYFSGGEKHASFVALFNEEELIKKFSVLDIDNIIIFGEAYGGSQQGMKATYGDKLKFIAFDVKIGESWLSVPQAQEIVLHLGLEFVHYERIPTSLEAIDAEREKMSVQAVRNGVAPDKKREGIVLRPLIEVKKNNGERVIAKHKTENFQEVKSKREVTDVDKLKVLREANEVAEEWVTPMRLSHIIGKIENLSMENMPDIIKTMIEDVKREGDKEIVWGKEVQRSISKNTANMVKEYFQNKLKENFGEKK